MVVDRDVTLLKRWLDRWALSEQGGVMSFSLRHTPLDSS